MEFGFHPYDQNYDGLGIGVYNLIGDSAKASKSLDPSAEEVTYTHEYLYLESFVFFFSFIPIHGGV